MAYALRSRLSQGVNDVFRRSQLSKRYLLSIELQSRCFASQGEIVDDGEVVQKPMKYTTSRANSETAKGAREKVTLDDSPWSQTISLGLSLAAFLIYFGMLREQNDLDDMLERDITDRVPALKDVHEKLQTSAGRAAGRNLP